MDTGDVRDFSCLSDVERDTLRDLVGVYRTRLASLSWFMKCLNEPIARQTNAEDRCTGYFWEARFSSQSICSERASLAAMAYVDLNPIRAKMVQAPDQSQFTSIKARLEGDRRRVLGGRSRDFSSVKSADTLKVRFGRCCRSPTRHGRRTEDAGTMFCRWGAPNT